MRRRAPADLAAGQIERPQDEKAWVSCRGRSSCEGKQAKILFRRNEAIGGTLIQYQCLTCKTPFSIRY